jgi:hypothetical protein
VSSVPSVVNSPTSPRLRVSHFLRWRRAFAVSFWYLLLTIILITCRGLRISPWPLLRPVCCRCPPPTAYCPLNRSLTPDPCTNAPEPIAPPAQQNAFSTPRNSMPIFKNSAEFQCLKTLQTRRNQNAHFGTTRTKNSFAGTRPAQFTPPPRGLAVFSRADWQFREIILSFCRPRKTAKCTLFCSPKRPPTRATAKLLHFAVHHPAQFQPPENPSTARQEPRPPVPEVETPNLKSEILLY